MNRVQKDTQIKYLKEVVEVAPSLVLIDFKGVDVETITRIRREFREANCEYKVIKNTLLANAVTDTPAEVLKPLLHGPVAIAYSKEDPAAPARVALKNDKEVESFEVKGGCIDGDLLDKEGVVTLSKMPSKQELRATLLATMLAVPQGLLRLMLAAPQRMLLVLDAKKRQMEETNE
ncbi:MAG: 50S ribosomal protein L10 [Deltaproteobacteria bacterium]|nr:50S ribosomal protein L10 [Deltaproteobacteria bacterium]